MYLSPKCTKDHAKSIPEAIVMAVDGQRIWHAEAASIRRVVPGTEAKGYCGVSVALGHQASR